MAAPKHSAGVRWLSAAGADHAGSFRLTAVPQLVSLFLSDRSWPRVFDDFSRFSFCRFARYNTAEPHLPLQSPHRLAAESRQLNLTCENSCGVVINSPENHENYQ